MERDVWRQRDCDLRTCWHPAPPLPPSEPSGPPPAGSILTSSPATCEVRSASPWASSKLWDTSTIPTIQTFPRVRSWLANRVQNDDRNLHYRQEFSNAE